MRSSEYGWPEYIVCVRRDENGTWCGSKPYPWEMVFQNESHADANDMQDGRLLACPLCRRALLKAQVSRWPSDEEIRGKVVQIVCPMLRDMISRTKASTMCHELAAWLRSTELGHY